MATLIGERPVKYPSESPLDGALLTFDVWGAYGNPAGITEVTAWKFQCDSGNPLLHDIGVIAARLATVFGANAKT